MKAAGPVEESVIREREVFLERKSSHNKLIIFALDETLVHCVENTQDADAVVEIKVPSGDLVQAGLNIRPYAIDLLKAANQHFEVAVFTASQKCYADVVLDHLDPSHSLIQHRLYRDSCVQVEGLYTKDLRILKKWGLKDVVLVDNQAYSFAN